MAGLFSMAGQVYTSVANRVMADPSANSPATRTHKVVWLSLEPVDGQRLDFYPAALAEKAEAGFRTFLQKAGPDGLLPDGCTHEVHLTEEDVLTHLGFPIGGGIFVVFTCFKGSILIDQLTGVSRDGAGQILGSNGQRSARRVAISPEASLCLGIVTIGARRHSNLK